MVLHLGAQRWRAADHASALCTASATAFGHNGTPPANDLHAAIREYRCPMALHVLRHLQRLGHACMCLLQAWAMSSALAACLPALALTWPLRRHCHCRRCACLRRPWRCHCFSHWIHRCRCRRYTTVVALKLGLCCTGALRRRAGKQLPVSAAWYTTSNCVRVLRESLLSC